MSEQFNNFVEQLTGLFERLISSPLLSRDKLDNLPAKGIYVFYENGVPVYVGRTDNLKRRLLQHSRPSSGHTSATFAFNLAKLDAQQNGLDTSRNRTVLETDNDFNLLFLAAKERVANMSIRVIEIEDPIIQTLFEVYAAIGLNTLDFNSFENH